MELVRGQGVGDEFLKQLVWEREIWAWHRSLVGFFWGGDCVFLSLCDAGIEPCGFFFSFGGPWLGAVIRMVPLTARWCLKLALCSSWRSIFSL